MFFLMIASDEIYPITFQVLSHKVSPWSGFSAVSYGHVLKAQLGRYKNLCTIYTIVSFRIIALYNSTILSMGHVHPSSIGNC